MKCLLRAIYRSCPAPGHYALFAVATACSGRSRERARPIHFTNTMRLISRYSPASSLYTYTPLGR